MGGPSPRSTSVLFGEIIPLFPSRNPRWVRLKAWTQEAGEQDTAGSRLSLSQPARPELHTPSESLGGQRGASLLVSSLTAGGDSAKSLVVP